jgi:hypothetical protein
MPSFGNAYFYHSLIRRYVIAFGSMFDDLTVARLDRDGTVKQTIVVPIAYGPKESWLVRIKQDPTLLRTVQVQVPAASFEILGLEYDGARKMQALNKEVVWSTTDKNKGRYAYKGLPWNIHFALYFYVRNADDGTQLLEQVLPFFGPEWTNTMTLVPTLGTKLDVPVILNTVHMDDVYEGDFVNRRALVWTLNFTMKAWLYGPVSTKGVIKTARTALRDFDTSAVNARIVLAPGLTANGEPTIHSNNSISASAIAATDPYGYTVDISELYTGEV